MATTTDINVSLVISDPTQTCCGACAGTVPKTLHISNNYGFYAVTYNATSGTWKASTSFSFASCSASMVDPHPPIRTVFTPPGDCLVPVVGTVTDNIIVTTTVLCPDVVGGPWKIAFSANAETAHHQFVGVTLGAHNCGDWGQTKVTSPVAESDDPGCDTAQTFPAPATPWLDSSLHAYAVVPDPGVSTMSS